MRLDQSVALANLRLELVDGRAELTLYTHHSLADAQHLFSLLERVVLLLHRPGDDRRDRSGDRRNPHPNRSKWCWRSAVSSQQSRSGFERLIPAMFVYDLPPSMKTGTAAIQSCPPLFPSRAAG